MRLEITTRNDAAILRWRSEYPDDFAHRFLSHLDYSTPCTLWTGGLSGAGYGRVRLPKRMGVLDNSGNGQNVLAHRVSWLTSMGSIPPGGVIDHGDPEVGCHVLACVNPEHLAVTTPRGNVMTGRNQPCAINSQKATCIRGHDLNAEGATWPSTRAIGKRLCRECDRLRSAERDELIRLAAKELGVTGAEFVRRNGASKTIARSVLNP